MSTATAHDPLVPLDTTIRIVTPENIAFSYRLSGPFRRLPAYLIDLFIMGLTMLGIALTNLLLIGSNAGMGLVLIIWFVIFWGYGAVCETLFNGQTPGKMALGLRVVSTGGLPINGQQAFLRNLMRLVDMSPLMALSAYYLADSSIDPLVLLLGGMAALAVIATARFQRLGDIAADTMVVVEERHRLQRVKEIADPKVEELSQRIPTSYTVSPGLAEALASYVARRELLGYERRRQMAGQLAAPLLGTWQLPADTDPDTLVCALYRRTYL